MIRVNLLPWRAERRRAQRRHLGILAGMVAALAAAIVVLIHVVIAGYISVQEGRNDYLKKQNADLDKQIEEIKKLRDEIAALLARKQVIERLQTDRAQAVHLLEQLVLQVPDGVYLRTMKQTGLRINLQGYAQANSRVSLLMRNFAQSPYLEGPELIEIKSAVVNNRRVSDFNMSVLLRSNLSPESPSSPAAKPGVVLPSPGKG